MTRAVNVAGLPGEGDAPIYSARAWVNFNGTGTVAIRAAGNVSSITDVGAGNYYINFSTPMPHANYAVVYTADASGDGNLSAVAGVMRTSTPTVNQVYVGSLCHYYFTWLDSVQNHVSVFA